MPNPTRSPEPVRNVDSNLELYSDNPPPVKSSARPAIFRRVEQHHMSFDSSQIDKSLCSLRCDERRAVGESGPSPQFGTTVVSIPIAIEDHVTLLFFHYPAFYPCHP